ncbi:MAG: SIR2 family protein, partial [Solirubrobacteraceae bacterium]
MVETHRRLVLSREDDLRFEGDGVAAAGVVQAMLLTRRLLLVGYSLSDDNFHRLVHQAGQLGWEEGWHRTAIALTPDPLGFAPSIWKDRVEFVSTADPSEAAGDSEGAPTGASNPRRLAILLDAIAAEAAQPIAHLADPTYARLFSDEALALGDALRQVDAAVGRLGDADRRAAYAV